MSRVAPVLAVLLLAGLVYLFLGGESDPGYDDYGIDPLDEGTDGSPTLIEDDPEPMNGGDVPSTFIRDKPPSDGSKSEKHVLLRGRVVDERRRPVAEANVSVRIGKRSSGGATTDGSGRFEIKLGARHMMRAVVVAKTEDGRSGTAEVWTTIGATGLLRVPTIVLRPVANLTVRVVDADGSGVGQATCVLARRSAGAPVVLGTHGTAGSGQLSVGGLPHGQIEVFASAPGKGRGHVRLTLPVIGGETPQIVLDGERRIDVRVIEAATRRPVQGAEILVGDRLSMPVPDGPGYLPPVGAIRTNAAGRASVSGLGANDKIFLNARAKGFVLAPWWKQARAGVEPGVEEVEIVLHGFRTVRFPVDAFSPETPPDGTSLALELDAQAARIAGPDQSAWLESGMLMVQGLPESSARGTVRTNDGVYATFTAPARVIDAGAVVFKRARDVSVRLLRADGGIASGVRLSLHPTGVGQKPLTATTDGGGIATFNGVGGDAASVHRARDDSRTAGSMLAKLDLTEELDVFDVELRETTNIILRLTAQGEPRLPPQYGLVIGGRPVLPEDVLEDPAAGTLIAPFENVGPKRLLSVRLTPEGFLTVERKIEVEGGDVEHVLDLELKAAGELIARVSPPPDGQFSVVLEQRLGSGTWKHAPGGTGAGHQPFGGPTASTETRKFTGLDAGTYRVRDPRSGIASEVVTVTPGEKAPSVRLDLASVGWIEGKVVGPAGASLQGARVLVEGKDNAGQSWAGAPVKQDGTFRIRLGRNRTSTLYVTHPTLRAAQNGGRVRVRGSESSVTLRLERGGEARFRITTPKTEGPPGPGAASAGVRIRLFKGAVGPEPLRTIRPVKDGDGYRFGGFEPGVYTLVIETGNAHVPVVKKNVTLGDGTTDLGAIDPKKGTTLRVRLGRRDKATRLWVTAVRKDEPTYTRTGSSREPGGDAVCSGLGAGTYAVTVRSVGAIGGGAGVLFEQNVSVDGRAERVIEVSGR